MRARDLLLFVLVTVPACANGGTSGDPPVDASVDTSSDVATETGACGVVGARCCAGPSCLGGLRCAGGTCVPDCGPIGSSCCAGDVCDSGAVCVSGKCAVASTCGSEAKPCCTGGTCAAPLVCTMGTCAAPTTCGAEGAPCCGADACGPGLVCAAGTCTRCGSAGRPCCALSVCSAGAVCTGGTCAACGAPGLMCCAGGGCASGYCYTGSCYAPPTLTNEGSDPGGCSDLGTAHLPPAFLARATIHGRPYATVHKYARHVSCASAPTFETLESATPPGVTLDATGTNVLELGNPAITDCSNANGGRFEAWVVVDGQESGHMFATYFNSGCPALSTCALAGTFCPP